MFPPRFPAPNWGPANGLHPRFVVAEIWADRVGGLWVGGWVDGWVSLGGWVGYLVLRQPQNEPPPSPPPPPLVSKDLGGRCGGLWDRGMEVYGTEVWRGDWG